MNQNQQMRPLFSILAVPVIALLCAPSATADTDLGDGTYAVPDAMGYGKYVADIAADSRGCTFSTYDAQGLPISTASAFAEPLTAIIDPDVATFRTSGCTPWVRYSRTLNGN